MLNKCHNVNVDFPPLLGSCALLIHTLSNISSENVSHVNIRQPICIGAYIEMFAAGFLTNPPSSWVFVTVIDCNCEIFALPKPNTSSSAL